MIFMVLDETVYRTLQQQQQQLFIQPNGKLHSDSHAIIKAALTIFGTHSLLMTEKCKVFNNKTFSELDI